MNRRCLTPGCNRLTPNTRCPPCTRARRHATYDSAAYRALGRPTGPCTLRLPGCTGMADSWDHILPVSRGGGHERSNVRPACMTCNDKRGNR
ncbi:hypothetical protein BayCH28_22300 [Mycolicibacterium sp. CH28]|uniref:HNH endonuclease n=1 Tax=Mycolicibacterium sp. CH28 TaxID=2512237 RepID=UPI0010813F9B|nr:hypothetical protein BayCH28_22300 [Mycolicibacterium sp. CH28]